MVICLSYIHKIVTCTFFDDAIKIFIFGILE